MINMIRQIFIPFKSHWKSSIALFIFFFSAIYYTGNTISWIATTWENGTSDLEKLYDIGTMLMHGVFLRAFASLWSLAPILMTLTMSLGLMSLHYALKIAAKEGRDHPALLIISAFNGLMLIGWFYYLVLK